jgi:hypothetical protein
VQTLAGHEQQCLARPLRPRLVDGATRAPATGRAEMVARDD